MEKEKFDFERFKVEAMKGPLRKQKNGWYQKSFCPNA